MKRKKGLDESKGTPREHPPSSRRRAQKARSLYEPKPKDAAPRIVLSAIVSATRRWIRAPSKFLRAEEANETIPVGASAERLQREGFGLSEWSEWSS